MVSSSTRARRVRPLGFLALSSVIVFVLAQATPGAATQAPAAATRETTPACTEVRVPWMMRLSTSRASWSVPSQ